MPVTDERGVFERLSLEAFQSGLSWLTILKKREAFRAAFHGFDPYTVASFTDSDVARLMHTQDIIRNQRKILATITNAQATINLHDVGMSLSEIVWSHMPQRSPAPENDSEVPSISDESVELAKVLKTHGYTFVGPTTMHALMTAIGVIDVHLVQSHRRGCSGLWNLDGSRVLIGDS